MFGINEIKKDIKDLRSNLNSLFKSCNIDKIKEELGCKDVMDTYHSPLGPWRTILKKTNINKELESLKQQNKLLMDYLKVEIVTEPERTYVRKVEECDQGSCVTYKGTDLPYIETIFNLKQVEVVLPKDYTLKVNGEVIEVKGIKKGTKKGGKKC